jgi:hypothetical protein
MPGDDFSKHEINSSTIIQTAALPQKQTLTKDACHFHNIHVVIIQTAIISVSDSDLIMPLSGIGNAHSKVPESSDQKLCQIGFMGPKCLYCF